MFIFSGSGRGNAAHWREALRMAGAAARRSFPPAGGARLSERQRDKDAFGRPRLAARMSDVREAVVVDGKHVDWRAPLQRLRAAIVEAVLRPLRPWLALLQPGPRTFEMER